MGNSRKNPRWVEADNVVAANLDGYVHVTYMGNEYRFRRVEWNDPLFDKTKSDVLVKTQSEWLRIWFNDDDIKPFGSSAS
jgi:hypothetical protein